MYQSDVVVAGFKGTSCFATDFYLSAYQECGQPQVSRVACVTEVDVQHVYCHLWLCRRTSTVCMICECWDHLDCRVSQRMARALMPHSRRMRQQTT